MNVTRLVGVIALVLLPACAPMERDATPDLKATAERFLQSVYRCSPAALDELADPAVRVSYPVFKTLYGTEVIRGVAAVKELSDSFCQKWTDSTITVHDAVQEGNQVVLVWEFSARDLRPESGADGRQRWGGVSVFRFNAAGLVLEEFGEESTPGPIARMTGDRKP